MQDKDLHVQILYLQNHAVQGRLQVLFGAAVDFSGSEKVSGTNY